MTKNGLAGPKSFRIFRDTPIQLNMTKTESHHPLQEAQPTKKEHIYPERFQGMGGVNFAWEAKVNKSKNKRVIVQLGPVPHITETRGRLGGG